VGLRSAASGKSATCTTRFGLPRRARWPPSPGRDGSRRGSSRHPARSASGSIRSRVQPRLRRARQAVLSERPAALLLSLGGTGRWMPARGFLELVQGARCTGPRGCDVTGQRSPRRRASSAAEGSGPAEDRGATNGASPPRVVVSTAVAGAGGSGPLASSGSLVSGAALVLDAIGFDPAATTSSSPARARRRDDTAREGAG
jgi:hypothetical protein